MNLQLIEETDEMATRQRSLLAENQVLRMRSCSRGFDAIIGRKLRENINPLIESCKKALSEAQRLTNSSGPDASMLPSNLEADLMDSKGMMLSDEEAIKTLDEYGDEVIGTTVAELRQMEDQSPRLGDVFTLPQLISSVKETHKTILALQKLKENAFILRDYLEAEEPIEAELVEVPKEPPRK